MRSTGARVRATRSPADPDPVARLMVDVPLAHLDHAFDYLVPASLDADVTAGSRVRVRFSGRLVDAYVLERRAVSEHDGKLAFVERAIGSEPVLTPETTQLFRAVAERWAGSFVDVVRLGVPSRHAGAEATLAMAAQRPSAPAGTGFDRYRSGAAFLSAVASHRPARAVWAALPGESWPDRMAEAVRTALATGRGAIVVVPNGRDLDRLDAAMTLSLGQAQHVALSADLGPAERYRRWLAVRRGAIRAVVGTRSAVYAPVSDLGLLAMWDDGDDLHAEPRAPYAHARDVLILRSSLSGAAVLLGGFARTAEDQLLIESGWAHAIAATRDTVRLAMARIATTGDDTARERDPGATAARLPSVAWQVAHDALAAGQPVLVQVPRRGYVPSLACVRDRTRARCTSCSGALAARSATSVPTCRLCGRPAGEWVCPNCGGSRMRASVIGSDRTAEELGRAFPGTVVRLSAGERVLATVEATPALVVATPGAEPVVEGGYGAALLLDGWALLSRADLRAGEEALRRWMNAAALVCSGGHVVVGADAGVPAVQALLRWDPSGAAARELAERTEMNFPPAARFAAVTGAAAGVAELLGAAQLPQGAEVIGPVPAGKGAERLLVRVPRARGAELASALKAAAAIRSARKSPDPVRLVLDPIEL